MHSNSYDFVVVVRVNTECALRCSFCGYSRDLGRSALAIDANKLEKFGRILQEFQAARNQRILVSWLGGEPFQWSKWRETSLTFRELGLALGITTNGLALCSEQVRDDAFNLFDQITISIDGLAESHDQMRQFPGMFDRLRGVVEHLQKSQPPKRPLLRVNTILTRRNVGQFGMFSETMAAWGFDELTMNQLGGNDRPEYFPDNRLTADQVSSLINDLDSIQKSCKAKGMIVRSSPLYLQRIYASAKDIAIPILDCSPGDRFLFIDESGQISPCSFTSQRLGISIDEIDTAEKLADLGWMFRKRRCGKMLECCGDCHATHVFEKFDTSRLTPPP
jgi:sulfatase maturation enzyme AslB (radical SAM superfamily)